VPGGEIITVNLACHHLAAAQPGAARRVFRDDASQWLASVVSSPLRVVASDIKNLDGTDLTTEGRHAVRQTGLSGVKIFPEFFAALQDAVWFILCLKLVTAAWNDPLDRCK